MIQQQVKTQGTATKITLRVDYSGKDLQAGKNDIVFVYAEITDNNGTVINNAEDSVDFEVSGDAKIIGPAMVKTEAGIAAILLKAGDRPDKITISARSRMQKTSSLILNSK